ncbi:MAG: hypothetical protein ACTSRZ_19965 [Promethearchaeota archaeon]
MDNVNNVNKKRQKEAFLESLRNGISIRKACKYASITEMTIWRWRKRSKAFDEEVLSILDSRTQTVEDALFMNALKGNVTAQIFWLKNRGKGRWKDKFEHDITEKKVIVIGKKDKDDDKKCKKP